MDRNDALLAAPPASLLERLVAYFAFPLLLLFTILWAAFRPIADPDIWFHMALGRQVLDGGSLPRTDIFSHTASGAEWISSGWLSSVLLHWLYATFGEDGRGPLAMVVAVVSAAYLAIYMTGVRILGARLAPVLALLLFAGLLLALPRFHPRPDIWSQLGLALTAALLLLADRRLATRPEWAATGRAPWHLWLLAPLFAIWANLHAGFPLGLLLVGLGAIVFAARRFGACRCDYQVLHIHVEMLRHITACGDWMHV